MADFRVYCVPPTRDPKEIELEEAEAHHLTSVNRAAVGDTVVAFDGAGHEWVCELAGVSKRSARLKVRFGQAVKPLPYAITLGQALPKGKYMDAIVRKATEIGVTRIVPLASERTEVHLGEEREDNKLGKWRDAAIEAAKQCGNAFLPEITPVQKAFAFMEASRGYDLKLIASLQPGAQTLRTVLKRFRDEKGRAPANVLWLIGPEGDFTPAEMSASRNAGFEPITLGPLVLRCETAATYALSILSYELQG